MTEWLNIGVGIIQLFCAIAISVLALYLGFRTFNKITKDIDEVKELARGNVAMGILVAAIFVAIALVVQSGVQGIVVGAGKASADGIFTTDGIIDLSFAVFQLVAGVLLAAGAIYLALKIFIRLNDQIDEFNEIKKGNIAVALMMAGMILAVAVIVHTGVIGITKALL
jgi:uncharacterized membrane protein YjfL (UPF0719 family)